MFLHCVGPFPPSKTNFTLRLVNQKGKADKEWKIEHQFKEGVASYGNITLVKQTSMADESEGWKVDDRVIIEAEVTVFSPHVLKVTKVQASKPPDTLVTDDLLRMLNSGMRSDIEISVVGCAATGSSGSSSSSSSSSSNASRTFQAHSQILCARSSYLCAMLQTPMVESATMKITESDVDPVVFEELLKYIYTGSVSAGALQEMGEYLMLAANKYGCEPLKQQCEGSLCEGIIAGNAASRLILSDQAEAGDLKEACLDFIKSHAAEVMQSEGWGQVPGYRAGALVVEAMQAMAGLDRGQKRSASEASGIDAELATVDGMTVAALKSALRGRSLGTSGSKEHLAARLKAAITESWS